jgi:hypothetical protein
VSVPFPGDVPDPPWVDPTDNGAAHQLCDWCNTGLGSVPAVGEVQTAIVVPLGDGDHATKSLRFCTPQCASRAMRKLQDQRAPGRVTCRVCEQSAHRMPISGGRSQVPAGWTTLLTSQQALVHLCGPGCLWELVQERYRDHVDVVDRQFEEIRQQYLR